MELFFHYYKHWLTIKIKNLVFAPFFLFDYHCKTQIQGCHVLHLCIHIYNGKKDQYSFSYDHAQMKDIKNI